MTTGAVIFAYNNEAFDYMRMAAWTASNVRRHLGIPVAVITDQPTPLEFDQVILHTSPARDHRWFDDAQQLAVWNNWSRPDVYDLTPWDRTLVLDADYVVASDQLNRVLGVAGETFLCHNRAQDVTGMNDFVALNGLGTYAWPLCWATLMLFDRGRHAELVFESMKMIRDNWAHYQRIYHDRSRTYRNDHALTIALNITNGHTLGANDIPWPLATVMPEHRLIQLDADHYRVTYKKSNNRLCCLEIQGQDFHAMGKQSLMDLIS